MDNSIKPEPEFENVPTNTEPEWQNNSDSEQDQPNPLDQQIRHSPIEPMQLPQMQPS
jgi:hypothetical protein